MFLKQKKGANKQFYMIAELLFAAIVILSFFYFVNSKVNDTTLEENYIARDLALLMEAIYAAPGDLEYTYPLKYDFDIQIASSEVSVQKGTTNYWYNHDISITHLPDDFNVEFRKEYSDKREIKFVKKNNELTITCSGCRPR